MHLVARSDTEGEGWSQLDAMRTNGAEVDSAAARGAMLLWAARNDYTVWLDQIGWATHYTLDPCLAEHRGVRPWIAGDEPGDGLEEGPLPGVQEPAARRAVAHP